MPTGYARTGARSSRRINSKFRALLDEDRAVTGQGTELADGGWRHKAGADEAVFEQLGDPGAVLDVGLAAEGVVDALWGTA
jgi:hypothetical protein